MSWKALVLGGGGVKGEFEVGVLEYLAEQGCGFDFFSGVSVGALNVSVLAQYQALPEAVAALRQVWASIDSNSDVYTGSIFGSAAAAAAALFTDRGIAADSMYGSRPLSRLISSHVKWSRLAQSGKGWAVGVTSLTDGSYYLVSNLPALLAGAQDPGNRLKLVLQPSQPGSIPDRVEEFILASASMPFLFPPVDIHGHRFVDGGLRDITPLSSAFDAARAAGATNPVILAVSTAPRQLPYRGENDLDSGKEILGRTLEILTHEILENDLEEAHECNSFSGPNLLRSRVFQLRPDHDPALDALDFDATSKRENLRKHGYEVAKRDLAGVPLTALLQG